MLDTKSVLAECYMSAIRKFPKKELLHQKCHMWHHDTDRYFKFVEFSEKYSMVEDIADSTRIPGADFIKAMFVSIMRTIGRMNGNPNFTLTDEDMFCLRENILLHYDKESWSISSYMREQIVNIIEKLSSSKYFIIPQPLPTYDIIFEITIHDTTRPQVLGFQESIRKEEGVVEVSCIGEDQSFRNARIAGKPVGLHNRNNNIYVVFENEESVIGTRLKYEDSSFHFKRRLSPEETSTVRNFHTLCSYMADEMY